MKHRSLQRSISEAIWGQGGVIITSFRILKIENSKVTPEPGKGLGSIEMFEANAIVMDAERIQCFTKNVPK